MSECNRNCFECLLDDCIYDGTDTSDIDTSDIDFDIRLNNARLKGREKDFLYRNSEEYLKKRREYQREYRKTQKYKDYMRNYCQTEKRKEYVKNYMKDYSQTEKYKESQRKYNRKQYLKAKENGICVTCKKRKAEPEKTQCLECITLTRWRRKLRKARLSQ